MVSTVHPNLEWFGPAVAVVRDPIPTTAGPEDTLVLCLVLEGEERLINDFSPSSGRFLASFESVQDGGRFCQSTTLISTLASPVLINALINGKVCAGYAETGCYDRLICNHNKFASFCLN